jgi:hypothetical protein
MAVGVWIGFQTVTSHIESKNNLKANAEIQAYTYIFYL